MNRSVGISAAVLGVTVLAGGILIYHRASDAGSISVASSSSGSSAVGVGGMVIHIDPATGKILQGDQQPSSPLKLSPKEQAAASTSSAGLVETQAPGGGTMVDLQGRFQRPLVATIGPDGKVIIEHRHGTTSVAPAN